MSETRRTETQVGISDLAKRFGAAGIQIIDQPGDFRRHSTCFVIGTSERQTDITIFDAFLDDLPNTKEYEAKVDSYAVAVAGRHKCVSPEVF